MERDNTVVAVYAYDSQNRRISKTVGEQTIHYHYDLNNHLIAESLADGTPLREYLYLDNEPLAMREYQTNPDLYYFINDHLGTPQHLVTTTGTVVWQAAYLPYGEVQVQVNTITNNLRFPGQYFDVETGLHYNWNRYYDPVTGRYISADPIGLEGGLNLYAYVSGNPVNAIDPERLAGWFYGYNSQGMPLHPSSSVMWNLLSREEQCKEQEAWLKEPPSDEFFENLMAGVLAGGGIASKQTQSWLDKNYEVITNKAGDKIFISKDGARRIRFDLNNPSPHKNPHAHVEELINGKWTKSGPVYTKNVPKY